MLDLLGLGLSGAGQRDEDLEIGAMTTLQEIVQTRSAYLASGALLPLACRTSVPSRLLRGMATLGGEAVAADPDSELVAALLALNAIFVVAQKDGSVEVPALRFLHQPARDLAGGALLRSVQIPGAPHGAALERAAALPSLPALVAVAVTTTFSGARLSRVRVAVTGLAAPPGRIVEAEALLERTAGEQGALEQAADLLARAAPFRDDARATAAERRTMARPLALRALRTAIEDGRRQRPPRIPALLPTSPLRVPPPMPYFTSGRLELTVNGRALRAEVDARTTLSELLRGAGAFGVKAGCGTGRCGACTVLLDGRPVAACLTLAVRAQGHSVVTIEGLGSSERPHPLQLAFAESGATQCGFCTPALVLSSRALLEVEPAPSPELVRDELTGLCRCTGYLRAVAAARAARGAS